MDSLANISDSRTKVERGLSCSSCQKQFPYPKRLYEHIEKKEHCKDFYKVNDLTLPVVKPFKTKNIAKKPKIDETESLEPIGPGNPNAKDAISVSDTKLYTCGTCDTDLMAVGTDLNHHIAGKCKVTVAEIFEKFEQEEKGVEEEIPADVVEMKKIADSAKKVSVEFKVAAIDKINEVGIKNISLVAKELNIRENHLQKWWDCKDKIKRILELNIQKAQIEKRKGQIDIPDKTVAGSSEKKIANYPPLVAVEKVLNFTSQETAGADKIIFKKKVHRCRNCEGCFAQDCGTCSFCLDKPKFGGKNTLRQKCIKKTCHVQLEEQRKLGLVSSENKLIRRKNGNSLNKVNKDLSRKSNLNNQINFANNEASMELGLNPSKRSLTEEDNSVKKVKQDLPPKLADNPSDDAQMNGVDVPFEQYKAKDVVENVQIKTVDDAILRPVEVNEDSWRPISEQFPVSFPSQYPQTEPNTAGMNNKPTEEEYSGTVMTPASTNHSSSSNPPESSLLPASQHLESSQHPPAFASQHQVGENIEERYQEPNDALMQKVPDKVANDYTIDQPIKKDYPEDDCPQITEEFPLKSLENYQPMKEQYSFVKESDQANQLSIPNATNLSSKSMEETGFVKEPNQIAHEESELNRYKKTYSRKKACNSCQGCLAPNCGICRNCQRPKLKKRCLQRKCINFVSVQSSTPTNTIMKLIENESKEKSDSKKMNEGGNMNGIDDGGELERALGSIGAEESTNSDNQNIDQSANMIAQSNPEHLSDAQESGKERNIHGVSSGIQSVAVSDMLKQLPPGLHIIPKTRNNQQGAILSENVDNFPVVSENHPSQQQDFVTIEKVSKVNNISNKQSKLFQIHGESSEAVTQTADSNNPESILSRDSVVSLDSKPQVNFLNQNNFPTPYDRPFLSSIENQYQPITSQYLTQPINNQPITAQYLSQPTWNSGHYEQSYQHGFNPSYYNNQGFKTINPYGVSIKTEPNYDLLSSNDKSQSQHNSSVELEEYINNDAFQNIINKNSLGDTSTDTIKQEIPDHEDNKLLVQSQLLNLPLQNSNATVSNYNVSSSSRQSPFPPVSAIHSTIYPHQTSTIVERLQPPQLDGPFSQENKVITMFPPNYQPEGEKNDAKEITISKNHLEKLRSVSKAVIKNEISLTEAARITGLNEEIIQCWILSLEDILSTNKEAVDKAKKFDELKSQYELMSQKFQQLKTLYLMSVSSKTVTYGENNPSGYSL